MNRDDILPSIPGPDDRNEHGQIIDVLKNLRAKKHLAGVLLPMCYHLLLDTAEYPGAPLSGEAGELMKLIREAAAMYQVNLEDE